VEFELFEGESLSVLGHCSTLARCQLPPPLDPAPPKHPHSLVKNGSLARRDPALGLGELDLDTAAGQRTDPRDHAGMARADLHRGLDLSLGVRTDPVEALAEEARREEILLRTHDDAIALGLDLEDVERARRGEAETAALAHGVAVVGLAGAELLAVGVHQHRRLG